jgi:hypothetical protein
MDVQVTTSGPLFDGTVNRVADQLPQDVAHDVGDLGVRMVRAELGNVLRNPTGRYENAITDLFQGDSATVWDSNVIYGNWLERGRTGTRFRGYATFRRVTQQLESQAVRAAQPAVAEAVRRLS